MKKIYIILAMLFVCTTTVFAGIDAKNIPEIINGENYAKFRFDRLETVARVNEEYDVKIGASILDITSSIFNNNYTVASTSLTDSGNVSYKTGEQFYLFPKKIFLGASMKIGDVAFGLGYQFAYSTLTLGDLNLGDTQDSTISGIDLSSSDYSDLLTDRMITSHTIAFGMVLLDGALELNIPFSFTAADNDYYSTYFEENSSGRAVPKGNMAFSMLPSVTYNTSGKAFTYVTTKFGFGMNEGTDVDNDYAHGYALGFSLEVEFGLNIMTDPINISWQPDIYFAIGVDSASPNAAIDAKSTSAHMVQYSKGNSPMLAYINMPIEFSSSIGNAITLYATPQIGLFYAKDGVTDMTVSGVSDKDTYGAMYGIEAGIGFAPIEDLSFNFDFNAIGGPNYTLQSDDYVYIYGADVVDGSQFTFGLNASVKWRF